MNELLIPGILLLLIFVSLFALVFLIARVQLRDYRAHQAEQKRRLDEHLAYEREMDPRYQMKVAADRKWLLDQEEAALKRFLALSRVETSQYGTYLVNQEQASLTILAPIHKPDAKLLGSPAQTQAIQIQRPSQDSLLAHLQHNMFLVSPGVQASTGEVVVVDLLKVPHLKIIGSSGFGKSCLAAAILDQATTTNDTRHMQLALLDLEHKTSRLFEDRPHIAELQDGRRRVMMVATNADEVATHLNILKKELDRRADLGERDLHKNPVLLMYVEEMLSLQYEVVDPKLLLKMFASLNILAVRGRKYGMFLLACMQTDYSTDELKVSQKQFRYRAAAAIDVPAARAAGFMNTDLIKENFQNGRPGQFVVEYPAFSDIVLAPDYDVRSLLNRKEGMDEGFAGDFGAFVEGETTPPLSIVKPAIEETTRRVQLVNNQPTITPQTSNDEDAKAWEAKVEQVRELRRKQWGKVAIIEHVWRPVKAGSNKPYKTACAQYTLIVDVLSQEERKT